MIIITTTEIASLVGGTLVPGDAEERTVRGVSNDTRTLEPGNCYIPILGPNFDGHRFLTQAIQAGASASLWHQDVEIPKDCEIPLILVEDTLKAFHRLALAYRKSLPVKVVALTGSNGKTSTKDIISKVLSKKYKVQGNRGNRNNEIGVPHTLLSLDSDTEIAVIEMGTERFGEIEVLTQMACPDVTMITNIGDSHLEELLTKENVAKEKLDIVNGMPSDGLFLYNDDDDILRNEVKNRNLTCKKLSFGHRSDCNYIVEFLQSTRNGIDFKVNGKVYSLPLIGKHQMYNATLAIIVAEIFDVPIEQIERGFDTLEMTGMRNEILSVGSFDILNDAYKSNPQSLRAALATLASLTGYRKKYAILGDMLGLGESASSYHYSIGLDMDAATLDGVYLYGQLSRSIMDGLKENHPELPVSHFTDKQALVDAFNRSDPRDALVLIKGSRAMHMEDVIEILKQQEELE